MSEKVVTTQDKSEGIREDGYVITVDLHKCIAAGPCSLVSPEVFKLRDSDGKAEITNPDSDTIENIISAAKSCPIFAISIKDKEEKQIYPQN